MQDFNYSIEALDQRASGSITVNDYAGLILAQATGTVTIIDYTKLIEASATGTIKIVDYTAIAGVTVTVDSVDYVEGVDFTAETSNDVTATNLASAIDADTQGASATTDTVTVTATTAGVAGNAIDMSTDDAVNITLSGSLLTGGQDHAVITVDSVDYTQGTDFTAETSNDVTATNLATAIDGDAQGASATTNVVTVTATTGGVAGNAIDLATSDAINATVSGATLTGGQDHGTITVGSDTITQGTDFTAETTNDVTATNIATALALISGLSASAVGAVVTVYATTPGTAGNSEVLQTNDAVSLTLSGTTLLGGLDETITPTFDYSSQEPLTEVEALLNVTALAGTTPTLDITPQYSMDKITFFDNLSAFTQATGVTHEALQLGLTGIYARFKIVLGGSDPIATGTITAIAK